MLFARSLISSLGFGVAALAASDPGYNCRPGQKCWPSWHEWQQLNETIDGHLYQTIPMGAHVMQTRHTTMRRPALPWRIPTTTASPEDPFMGRLTGQTGKLVVDQAVLYYLPTQKRPYTVHALLEDSQHITSMLGTHRIYQLPSNSRKLTTLGSALRTLAMNSSDVHRFPIPWQYGLIT